jgi:hypothetical protein
MVLSFEQIQVPDSVHPELGVSIYQFWVDRCQSFLNISRDIFRSGMSPLPAQARIWQVAPVIAAIFWLAAGGARGRERGASGELPKTVAWQSLFNGKSLQGWRETLFTGRGQVRVEGGTLVLGSGKPMTGVT